jgi:type II restriction/modification system DNA methylase subunit YeeA
MTPQEFVEKWSSSTLRERQGSQEHFIDICRMLDEQTPAEADPTGHVYCFDAGAEKTIGRDGFADVWKKDCFAWEYKGPNKNLQQAFAQLQQYANSLQNPPLLVVSDMDSIIIHTNFTYAIHEIHAITLSDLLDTEKRKVLKWAFSDPEQLRPGLTRAQLTEHAAKRFAEVAQRLRDRQYEPRRVAHFMNKMLFAMFAEDIGLLPPKLFTRLLELASRKPNNFQDLAQDLFSAMKGGGRLGLEEIDWFNGGLFDDDDVIPLEKSEIDQILEVSRLDWSSIEPSIFGTLFERGLDPSKRSQLGAHFTDPQSIMRIVNPVILEPLRREWEQVRQEIAGLMMQYRDTVAKSATKAEVSVTWDLKKEQIAALRKQHRKPVVSATAARLGNNAREMCQTFLQRLESLRVLDPACGSGNFLYLALLGLKDLEHQVITEAEALGLPKVFPAVGPPSVMGIEINLYAAELARVTIWIGQIQWMLRHGWGLSREPILKPLDQISCRDAVLNADGSESEWPAADYIIGNPPFLGDKKMLSELGDDYVLKLRSLYGTRVPGAADYVTYWFNKAWQQILHNHATRAGLVATNSIRGGQNRKVLDEIEADGSIFDAWDDEPWVLNGAAVRVSIICFTRSDDPATRSVMLNGIQVDHIFPDLTAGTNLTKIYRLTENTGRAFQGPVKVGRFDIPGELAREWLQSPSNPNGRPNSDVLRPWMNGRHITKRPADKWIIDFGQMPLEQAALYQEPFEYVARVIKPKREENRDKSRREKWWLLGRSGEELRAATAACTRVMLTPRVAKHRLFAWIDPIIMPDSAVVAITCDSDVIFGILQSRFHEAWSLRTCTWLGVGNDPRYTPRTTFEPFPFPAGFEATRSAEEYNDNPHAVRIADAARQLNELRQTWLNPPELVQREPEVVAGFPDRLLAVSDKAEKELKKRTLTILYNTKPTWLQDAHAKLDAAVAAAYGWRTDIPEEEALANLLELNHERGQSEGSPSAVAGADDLDEEVDEENGREDNGDE